MQDGSSKSAAYAIVAGQYGCSRDTVRLWLEEAARIRARAAYRNYYRRTLRQSERWYSRKLGASRFYMDMRYHIDKYLANAIPLAVNIFTLSEAVEFLAQGTGVRLKESTLEKLCEEFSNRTGATLLEHVDGSQAYRLYRAD